MGLLHNDMYYVYSSLCHQSLLPFTQTLNIQWDHLSSFTSVIVEYIWRAMINMSVSVSRFDRGVYHHAWCFNCLAIRRDYTRASIMIGLFYNVSSAMFDWLIVVSPFSIFLNFWPFCFLNKFNPRDNQQSSQYLNSRRAELYWVICSFGY